MADSWYYARGGDRQGPVPGATLRDLAASGQLGPDDLVWKEGLEQWVPAKAVKGLFPAPAEAAAPPPPPPPVAPAPYQAPPPPVPAAAPAPYAYPAQPPAPVPAPYAYPAQPPAPAPAPYAYPAQAAAPAPAPYAYPGQPGAPGARPAPAARSGGGLKVVVIAGLVTLVLLAAIGAALYYFVFMRRGLAGLDLAAGAPKECIAVLAVSQPSQSLTNLVKTVDDFAAGNAMVKEQWKTARQEAKDNLGFDVFDATAWPAAGFDPAQPATVAVLEMDSKAQEPTGAVFSLGLKDVKAAMDTVGKIAAKQKITVTEDTSGSPKVTLVGKELGVAEKGGRLFFAAGPPAKDKAQLLRDFFTRSAASPLSATDGYRQTVGGLPGGGDATGYVALSDIIAATPPAGRPPIAQDLLGLAFAGSSTKGSIYLRVKSDSKLLEYLQPGTPCSDLVKKMDPPIGFYCLSLADPVKAVTGLAASFGAPPAFEQEMKSTVQQNLGLNVDDLTAQLKGGCIGAALYPGSGQPGMPVSVLVFLRVTDTKKIGDLVAAKVGPMGMEKKTFGNDVLYADPKAGMAVAIAGNYVVGGTAVAQITALASGQGKGWSPAQSLSTTLYLEADLSEAAKMAKNMPGADPSTQMAVQALSGVGGRVFISLAKSGNGLLLNLEKSAK